MRAALANKKPDVIQDRIFDEFLDRLRENISFFVKGQNPQNFEQALSKAIHFEMLLKTKNPSNDNGNAIHLLERSEINVLQSNRPRRQPFRTYAPPPQRPPHFNRGRSQPSANFTPLMRTCRYGILTKGQEIYQTHNELTFEFPLPVFGSFVTKIKEVTNCFLIPTEIIVDNQKSTVDSPFGVPDACLYSVGHCSLPDGSVLL